MSKLCIIIFIIISITFNCTNYINIEDVFYGYQGEIHIHTQNAKNIPYTQCIQNGKGYIYQTNLNNLNTLMQNTKNQKIIGITILLNTTDVTQIINQLGLQYVTKNNIEVLGYSSLIPFSIDIQGIRYNTQIVTKDSKTIIGFPAILGSF